MLADIMIVGFNFCPRGWAMADGQILPINQNQSLFSLLGTTYGGDGRTTFALPDLRGRTEVGTGTGAGLPTYQWGAKGGTETTTYSAATMAPHNHNIVGAPAGTMVGTSNAPSTNDPTGHYLSTFPAGALVYSGTQTTADPMSTGSLGLTVGATIANQGGQQPVDNMQPYQVLNFCIATTGLFPSRP